MFIKATRIFNESPNNTLTADFVTRFSDIGYPTAAFWLISVQINNIVYFVPQVYRMQVKSVLNVKTNEKKLRNVLGENFQKPMRYCEIDEWFARTAYRANYSRASVTTISSYKSGLKVTSKAISLTNLNVSRYFLLYPLVPTRWYFVS